MAEQLDSTFGGKDLGSFLNVHALCKWFVSGALLVFTLNECIGLFCVLPNFQNGHASRQLFIFMFHQVFYVFDSVCRTVMMP